MNETEVLKEMAVINGKRSEYKKFALARQLGLPDHYKFSKEFLQCLIDIPIGTEFTIHDNIFTTCYLMKKRAMVKLDQLSGYKKEKKIITLTF